MHKLARTVFMVMAFAAPAIAAAEPTRLLMQPDIHGDRVVFRHGGDLWIASVQGGTARRLTTSDGVETTPRFSPDGSRIAFTGQYDSNEDVYVVPASGGEPVRVTFHPGDDILRDWTPDGTALLFASGRENPPAFVHRLWTIAAAGGRPEPLPLYAAADGAYSPEGARLAFVPTTPAFQPWPGAGSYVGWRLYRGGRTSRIRVVNLGDLSVTDVPRNNSNDHYPMWVGDQLYFLSDREGTMNLFAYDESTVRRVTSHDEFDIQSAGTDGRSIVYEQAGYLHRFDPATGQSRRIDIEVQGDFPWTRPRFEKVSDNIRSARLSPTGVRAVVEARGDILTVPAEKGDPRNLSDSPAIHDRSPAWSPDGERIAWFSDASGEYTLMISDQTGLNPPNSVPIVDKTFFYAPTWSPDSKYLLFADNNLNLWYVDADKGKPVKVDSELFGTPPPSFQAGWSPDSKWIAYARSLPNKMSAIFMYSLQKGESYRVTDGLSDAVSPAFDASGKYLYFLASTNYALNVGWLDMTSYERQVTRGLYLAVLAKDEPSPFLPESDEENAKDEKEEDKKDEKGEGEKKNGKKAPPELKFDPDHIDQRILAVDVPVKDYAGVAAGPENVVFYAERAGNDLNLHKYDLKKRKGDSFIAGINGYDVSADRKKLLYRAENRLGIVETSKDSAKVGDGALKLDGLQVRVEPASEWAQMNREAWRIMRDFFYDPTLHGADWLAMYDKYRAWLPSVRHRSELTYLNAMMLSEVVAGHTRTGGGDMPTTKNVPVGLIGADLSFEDGKFRIVRILHGENWNPDLRAPLSAPGVDVAEGDYLLAVNGREIDGGNLYAYFEGTADRQTVLRVGPNANGRNARDVTVVPLANDFGLRTRQWMEDNRKKVDEMSGGRLAYVYLPNTAQAGYANFNRYYYAQQDKLGAVIDERFNGGGKAADYIVEFMDRPLMSNWASRNGESFTSPNAAIFGPKVMIINEWAGSGGDYMPWAFKKRGVGPLIGRRTWGGLIGVSQFPALIDGGFTTAPSFAIYSTDPDNPQWIVENEGVAPDIEVDINPADVAAGRDPQLERAVQECLRLLEANPVRLAPRPEPIDRVNGSGR
jgi:tricorn protease